MAYEVYLGGIRFPVAPAKLQMKIKGQNKTMNLINGNEINILNPAGLTEVSFDVTLPSVEYPFAEYEDGFEPPEYFLGVLENMKLKQKPVRLILIRESRGRGSFFDTNMAVSLEDYSIKEDAKDGPDITVSINLKQYIFYGAKKIIVQTEAEKETEAEAVTEEERDASSAPSVKTYTVKRGDCLWGIAKRYLGNGGRYKEIYDLNRDQISDPNMIQIGQMLQMPG